MEKQVKAKKPFFLWYNSTAMHMRTRRENAKKRAVVAVARKLAVLLHRLWLGGEVYESLRNSQREVPAVA